MKRFKREDTLSPSDDQRSSPRGNRNDQSPRGANGHHRPSGDSDVFEFSDESSASNMFKRPYMKQASRNGNEGENGEVKVKLEEGDASDFATVSPSDNSTGGGGGGGGFSIGLSESDLRPTMDDLNNIFDTSDSESNGPTGLGGLSDNEREQVVRTHINNQHNNSDCEKF